MQMFLYLADVQRHDTGKIILGELENLQLPFGRPSIKLCIKQIDRILDGHKETVFANFYARIGLCLLDDAWKENPDDIEDNLKMALSYAEQYQNHTANRSPMGAITCARIILAQWAVRYFAAKKDQLQLHQEKLRKFTAQYYFSMFCLQFLTAFQHIQKTCKLSELLVCDVCCGSANNISCSVLKRLSVYWGTNLYFPQASIAGLPSNGGCSVCSCFLNAPLFTIQETAFHIKSVTC